MFFLYNDEENRTLNVIATGLVWGRYKISVRQNGKKLTTFTIAHTYKRKDKDFLCSPVNAWGDEAARCVEKAFREKKSIVVFGVAIIDSAKTAMARKKHYIINSATVMYPPEIGEIAAYHKSSMRYDAALEEGARAFERIRYDYADDCKEEDHLL